MDTNPTSGDQAAAQMQAATPPPDQAAPSQGFAPPAQQQAPQQQIQVQPQQTPAPSPQVSHDALFGAAAKQMMGGPESGNLFLHLCKWKFLLYRNNYKIVRVASAINGKN